MQTSQTKHWAAGARKSRPPPKRKVGIMLVAKEPQKLIDSQILRCNDPNEPNICWYAVPTAKELLGFQAKQSMDPAIRTQHIKAKPDGPETAEQPEGFQPTWSRCCWKNHFTARDGLIAHGMGDYGVVCVGYTDQLPNGSSAHDAQIGLTGTVEDGESFWDAGVREAQEECNVKIERSRCLVSFQEKRNGKVTQEIFVVVID